LLHPHKAPKEVKRIFDEVDGKEQRVELNLYVSGYEDEPEDREEQGVAGRETPEEPSMPETED
jgi:succinate dehydrogenase / fumarate reductase iron-sulfur subunit